MIYVLVIFGVMVLDRIVKTAVDNSMDVGDTIPVLGDFFHITYIRNTGAAFSLLEGHTLLLILVPAIIIGIAIIFICFRHKAYKPIFMFSIALICGGGLGNLTDRAAYSYVIDMFDFGFFPVFNVADICVCVGCGLLLLYLILFGDKGDKGEKKEVKSAPPRKEKAEPVKEKKNAPAKQGKKPKRLK
ncbi:MAG: signal peptidase II [Bacillota bacterium]|nr:signal peptidase II [Bacillota bacterium]